MSYAICRVQKVKGASSVHGIQVHQRREKESNSNPDIDCSLKSANYSLLDESTKSFNTLADERIKQAYTGEKAIRKDAVKVVSALFTSDNDFFQDKSPYEQRRFFENCYDWACIRFGKDNIFSAIVHMDEATPHLHLEFVPLTADGRLSAKAVLGGRTDLQRMQDDFCQKVGKPWGLARGERADLADPEAKPPRKHLKTAELKQKTAAEVKVLQLERDRLKKLLDEELKAMKERMRLAAEKATAEYNDKIRQFNEKLDRHRQAHSWLHSQGFNLSEELKRQKQEKDPFKNRCETLYEPFLQKHFGIELSEKDNWKLYYVLHDKITETNKFASVYSDKSPQTQQFGRKR
jgi:hypothetical protein